MVCFVCSGTLTQNKMSVENLYCNMELHRGATFQAPPAAPQASLDRASRLARQSLARRSNLGRPSQLGRTSRQVPSTTLGRTSAGLARVSHDPATQMSVSRCLVNLRVDHCGILFEESIHAWVVISASSRPEVLLTSWQQDMC